MKVSTYDEWFAKYGTPKYWNPAGYDGEDALHLYKEAEQLVDTKWTIDQLREAIRYAFDIHFRKLDPDYDFGPVPTKPEFPEIADSKPTLNVPVDHAGMREVVGPFGSVWMPDDRHIGDMPAFDFWTELKRIMGK
jgi:hypothetical protein